MEGGAVRGHGAAASRPISTVAKGPSEPFSPGELLALDRACRERCGLDCSARTLQELGAAADAQRRAPPLASHRRQSDVPAGRLADWPEVPGLELVDVLGSGGMGVVFKARQVALDRDVAVKFLRDAHRAEPGRRERFVQEARAIARLRHPHLVQLYEFGEVPAAGGAASQPYLVLEYVPGGSLADVLRGSPQSPGEAARLVATLADAIHYAHQQGVIHRDLKPANVLLHRPEVDGEGQSEGVHGPRFSPPRVLTADLCAKVTDFGLAKFLAGGDLTHSGDVLGTPSYMAPEQAAGKSAPITAAVDVYGLGAILYEALTGRPPFAAATVDATLGLVRQDEPVPPRRLQPTVPRDLETICLKCLRKEAGRRYATARDLAVDLRRFEAGEPVRARPVGTSERVIVWCRRKPGFAGLVAALVLVFLAGSSGVLWQWQPRPRAQRRGLPAGTGLGPSGEGAGRAPFANGPRSSGPAEPAGGRPLAATGAVPHRAGRAGGSPRFLPGAASRGGQRPERAPRGRDAFRPGRRDSPHTRSGGQGGRSLGSPGEPADQLARGRAGQQGPSHGLGGQPSVAG